MTKEEQEELDALEAEALSEFDSEGNTDSEEGEENSNADGDEVVESVESEDHGKEAYDSEDGEQSDNSDDSNDYEEEEEKVDKHTINVNGRDIELSFEDLQDLAKEGAKAKSTAPVEKTDEELLLEQNKISADDLALLIKAKNGDVAAISALAKQGGIDSMDIDESKADAFKNDLSVQRPSEIDVVANEIMRDTELHSMFSKAAETLPPAFINRISSNAQDLKAFAGHLKSGLADEAFAKAYPRFLRGEDFYNAYVQEGSLIAKERQSGMDNSRGSRQSEKRQNSKKAVDETLKHLGTGNNSGGQRNSSITVDDIWDMSDEEVLKLDAESLK